MDPQITDIVEAIIYAAGAVGVAHFWYCKKRSDNETYAARQRSLNESFAARIKATQELLSDPNYIQYLQRRTEIADKILKDDPKFLDRFNAPNDALRYRIDAIVGDHRIE